MACWVGLPYLGVRRYFAFGIPDDPAQSLTILVEWRAKSNTEFERVPLGSGPNPDLESFFAFVEKLLGSPGQAAAAPEHSEGAAGGQVEAPAPAEQRQKKWWQFWE